MVEERPEEVESPDKDHAEDRDGEGLSQYSGTTARTSYDEQQLEGMVPSMIVDTLPNLFDSACKILDLIPAGASLEMVKTMLEELKIPGSKKAKRMQRCEERFKGNMIHYGERADFIKPHLVVTKIFKSPDLVTLKCRPDAVIYIANLATAVKEVLVMQRGTQSTSKGLQGLDLNFPEAFMTDFGNFDEYGSSDLIDASFRMALELRTQNAIETLTEQKLLSEQLQTTFEPDKILAQIFYQDASELASSTSEWTQFFRKGKALDILQPVSRNSNDQKLRIKERVKEIRESFPLDLNAEHDGDKVDFENLTNRFPWPKFVTEIFTWSRSRLDELTARIERNGGVTEIAESIDDFLENNDSQVVESPRPRLQPSPEIKRSAPIKR